MCIHNYTCNLPKPDVYPSSYQYYIFANPRNMYTLGSERRIFIVFISFLVLLPFISYNELYTHLELRRDLLGTTRETTRRTVNGIVSMFQRGVSEMS